MHDLERMKGYYGDSYIITKNQWLVNKRSLIAVKNRNITKEFSLK